MCGNVFQSHTCEIPPHLLPISTGHNTQQRERKAPNALIHWIAALLLLQRKKRGSLQRFGPYLSSSSQLSASFVFLWSFNPSIYMLSGCLTPSSFKSVCLSTAVVFSPSPLEVFAHFLSSFTFKYSPVESLCLNPSSRLDFSICWTFFWNSPLLCSRARRSGGHLSMSARFPAQKACHSPRPGHPPVSSLSRHEEKLARGSDNPLTLHLSSARGKAPF